jgi:hypothetical protein
MPEREQARRPGARPMRETIRVFPHPVRVSLLGQRLAATAVAMWVIAFAAIAVLADTLPDSTWVALKPLPHQGRSAIFALAVDPSNNQSLVAGNSEGSLLRSSTGGTTWSTVHAGKASLTTIAYSPFTTGLVLAGTRGSGALVSRDGGGTWSAALGLEGRSVRVFAFALTIVAAGTDRGVYVSPDGINWSQSGLTNRNISAIAVEAIHEPVRLVAGSDAQASSGALSLYQSLDGGATWAPFTPPISGTIVVKLAAGPLPPTGTVRPLIVGTNTGLFASTDSGVTFNPLSGGALLPATDYTQVTFITDHYDRLYAGSDGGGSKSGGLWRTNDAGQDFISLQPPEASVSALAVSSDENPTLYVATFQPSTHVASLWTYHDTGGTPQGPPSDQTPVASGSRAGHAGEDSLLSQILSAPQLPYVGLGLGALAVVMTAVVAHLRGRYR